MKMAVQDVYVIRITYRLAFIKHSIFIAEKQLSSNWRLNGYQERHFIQRRCQILKLYSVDDMNEILVWIGTEHC